MRIVEIKCDGCDQRIDMTSIPIEKPEVNIRLQNGDLLGLDLCVKCILSLRRQFTQAGEL